MHPPLAMAGLAEAAVGEALMADCCGALFLILVAAVGFFARSRFATMTAALLTLAAFGCCVPWGVLGPIESNDSDARGWLRLARMGVAVWVLGAVATVAAWVRVFVLTISVNEPAAQPDPVHAPPVPPVPVSFDSRPVDSITPQYRIGWLLLLCLGLLCLSTCVALSR